MNVNVDYVLNFKENEDLFDYSFIEDEGAESNKTFPISLHRDFFRKKLHYSMENVEIDYYFKLPIRMERE